MQLTPLRSGGLSPRTFRRRGRKPAIWRVDDLRRSLFKNQIFCRPEQVVVSGRSAGDVLFGIGEQREEQLIAGSGVALAVEQASCTLLQDRQFFDAQQCTSREF